MGRRERERKGEKEEREDGLVFSNDHFEQNIFLKLEMETTRLSCIIGDIFPLTAIKTAIKLIK